MQKNMQNENYGEIEIAEYTINQTEDEVLRNLYERKSIIFSIFQMLYMEFAN